MAAVLRDRVLVGQAGALHSSCPSQICRVWCCLLLWPPIMRWDSLLSLSVFQGSSDSPGVGDVRPLRLILPSQSAPDEGPLCKQHLSTSQGRAYTQPQVLFRVEPWVSSVFRCLVSPALTLPFFPGGFTGPSNGVLCSPRVRNQVFTEAWWLERNRVSPLHFFKL